METSWTNIFWLILVCSILLIILISVGCYLCKPCKPRHTEGKQETNSLERRDSIRTQVSICSVWSVDEVGQEGEGRTELEKDNTEGEANHPESRSAGSTT